MKNFIFLFCLVFTTLLHAQEIVSKEALLSNKDITWVGEYFIKLPFDMAFWDVDTSKGSRSILEKMYNHEHWMGKNYSDVAVYTKEFQDFLNVPFFSNQIQKKMNLKNSFFLGYLKNSMKESTSSLNLYKDSELKQQYSKAEIDSGKIDFINQLGDVEDPENPKPIYWAFHRTRPFFGAKVYVYFDKSTSSWNLACKSICIGEECYFDNKNEYLKFRVDSSYVASDWDRECVWMPVYNLNSRIDYTQPQFTFANKTTIGIAFDNDSTYKITNGKIIKKSEEYAKCNEIMMNNIHKDNGELFADENFTDRSKYYTDYKDSNKKGKVWTDEETFEVRHSKFEAKDLTQIRFTHEWYWDNKEKKLKIMMMGFAPIVKSMIIEKDDWVESFLLFWKKTYAENSPGTNSKGK
jgi:hypothetical protein